MARLHVPAIAVGLLLFLGAALTGVAAFLLLGGTTVGLLWGVTVFLGVGLAMVVVTVLRTSRRAAVEQR